MTEIFTTRLSRRNQQRTQKLRSREELEKAVESCRVGIDPSSFETRFISDSIGKGVFTTQEFQAGDYLLEYQGELLLNKEAKQREKQYDKQMKGSFMYFFKFREKILCLDSTNDSFSKGRFVNDATRNDPLLNSEMRVITESNCPHLCLFATRDIKAGEELRFDYGVGNLPWRKKSCGESAADDHDAHCHVGSVGRDIIMDDNETQPEDHDAHCNVGSVGRDIVMDDNETQPEDHDAHSNEGSVGCDILMDDNETQPEDHDAHCNVDSVGRDIVMDDNETQPEDHDAHSNVGSVGCDILMDDNETQPEDHDAHCHVGSVGRDILMDDNETQPEEHFQNADSRMEDAGIGSAHEDGVAGKCNQTCPVKARCGQPRKCTTGRINSFPGDSESFDFDDDETSDYKPEAIDESTSDSDKSEIENQTSESLAPTYSMNLNSTNTQDLTSKSLTSKTQTCSSEGGTPSILVIGTSGKNGQRAYDKRYCCPYCGKLQAKLPRHIVSMHKDEREVVAYTNETNREIKDKMLCKMRNLGNHLHNTKIIKEGSGSMLVTYRPNTDSSWEDYIPCDMCLGYYVRHDLWKHRKRCALLPEGKTTQGRVITASKMLLPSSRTTGDGLSHVLSTLSSDDISRIVKSDDLIIHLGEKMYRKVGHDQDQFPSIRNTMRELARLLQTLREYTGPADAKLANFIQPSMFQTVIAAAKKVAGYSEETHLYKTPSLALKIGHSVKKCAKILKGISLQNGDETLLKEATRFLQLCDDLWTEEISTHALRTLGEMKRNNVKLLPLTSDCKMLSEFLKNKGSDASAALEVKHSSTEAWTDLCQVTLVQIILFNRRRQGEVSKMKLKDLNGDSHEEEVDIEQSLTNLEKRLCKSLVRIEIVGKRGRTVPIILTKMMKRWLDLLVACREQAGVNTKNQFVFARACYGSITHVRGSDCLRIFSEDCGAKKPKLLRSTKLRKQIATLSQILNLKDNELDLLADFLGHDIRVHREFYRLPEHTLQVAKVSKLLFAMENGQISEQCGKQMSEIEVTLDEEIGVEVDEEDVSDPESEDEDGIPTQQKDEYSIHGDNKTPGKKQTWTEVEKAAVLRHFEAHIGLGRIPKKDEIGHCLARESSLKHRSWRNVKDFVRNKITTRKNKSSKLF